MSITEHATGHQNGNDLGELLPGFSRSQIDGPHALRGVLAWDAPILQTPARHAYWREFDVAVIGSRRLLDGLRPLCAPIQLTRENWRLVRDTLRPKLAIVDAFVTSADGHWSLDDLSDSRSDSDSSVASILQGFRDVGIPTVFWNTFDVVYGDRFKHLTDRCDFAACSDGRLNTRDYNAHLAAACAPSVQSALGPAGRFGSATRDLIDASEPASHALFDGWANLIRHRSELSFLDALGDGLAIVESRYRIWANQKKALGELQPALVGCVTRPSLWSLTRHTSVRLAAKTNLFPEHEAVWDTIEAASCGTATALRGRCPEDIPDALCRNFNSDDAIIEAVKALYDDPVDVMMRNQKAWRYALEGQTYAHRLDAICEALGLEAGFASRPLVTVLCATYRTEYIEHIVSHFDAQTYPDKELVMVVNSSTLAETDVREKVGERDDVRITVVPAERVEAGSLNHGIFMARGEYIVKMDDDDIYGPHYVSDMIHHAQSHDLHLFGKTNRFFYFTDQNATYMRNAKSACTMVAPDELMAAHIGGASLSGKREFFRRYPYREGNFAATDTHYYANLEHHVDDGRVAVLDDTGFLYRRRSASEHSWAINNNALRKGMTRLCDGILKQILE